MFRDLSHAMRLISIGRVFARQNAMFVFDLAPIPPLLKSAATLARQILPGWRPVRGAASDDDVARGKRLADALQMLGPSFIKLGQFLATRPDVVGADLTEGLIALQDKLPPFSGAEARRIVAQELGHPLEEMYASFDDKPVAAASISQVHFATIQDPAPAKPDTESDSDADSGGEAASPDESDGMPPPRDVAVKVLRPGIDAAFRRDLDFFRWLAEQAEKRAAEARRLRPVDVVTSLESWVQMELDLRYEAAAASELKENMAGDEGYAVPSIDWDHTSHRVMTQERVIGLHVMDRDGLIEAGHDVTRLAGIVVETFLTQALRDGFFHADLHQGNMFVRDDGVITVVDFGIMGRLDKETRRYLAEILYGFIKRDYRRVAEVHFEAGYVPRTKSVESFAQALRSIGEPIHGRPLNELSLGKLLAQLFEATRTFDMETQPQLLLLQKTMVAAEGIAHVLDPKVNLWDVAAPLLETWLRENIGPDARLRDAAEGMADFARRIPVMMERIGHTADALSKGEVRLDPENSRTIAREIAAEQNRLGLFGRVPFWIAVVLAGALIIALI